MHFTTDAIVADAVIAATVIANRLSPSPRHAGCPLHGRLLLPRGERDADALPRQHGVAGRGLDPGGVQGAAAVLRVAAG